MVLNILFNTFIVYDLRILRSRVNTLNSQLNVVGVHKIHKVMTEIIELKSKKLISTRIRPSVHDFS